VEVWINPACSKCRTALSAFDEAGILIRRPIITADDGTALVGRTDDAVQEAISRAAR
jgi:arsenate reductase